MSALATKEMRPVKERPILFSDEMVRAILEGRKTQTRRVIKVQPVEKLDGFKGMAHHVKGALWRSGKPETSLCPYGQPGNRLWVREAFAIESDDCSVVDPYDPPFSDGRPIVWSGDEDSGMVWKLAHYRATDPAPELACGHQKCQGYVCQCPWKPSIHMPRWASRITLEITEVRVERVQEISDSDSFAEGIKEIGGNFAGCYSSGTTLSGTTAKECYRRLWDKINAKRGFGWDQNPWVWIIEFKVL